MAYTDEDLRQILLDFGVKITTHRLELLRYMSKSKLPIPASKIIDIMHKKFNMNQATVYRGLNSLLEAQILNVLEINKVSHYEMNFGESSVLVSCTHCGAMDRLSKVNLDEIIKKTARYSKKFASISSVNLQIHGLCRACQR